MTFGRFNPPTVAHGMLISKVKDACPSNYRVYLSHTQDSINNPLDYSTKVGILKGMFPEHAENIIQTDTKTIFGILVDLYKEGITELIITVGQDRINEFTKIVTDYNGVDAKHGFYEFKTINIQTAGVRDPDSQSITGISSTKMRQAVLADDYETFLMCIPSSYNPKHLYEQLRGILCTKSAKTSLNEQKTM